MIVFKANELFDIKTRGGYDTANQRYRQKSGAGAGATGLSLAEVARRAGIAKSTLSQLESGNGNPSLETLWSLCVALDIPFAVLLEPQVNKRR